MKVTLQTLAQSHFQISLNITTESIFSEELLILLALQWELRPLGLLQKITQMNELPAEAWAEGASNFTG